MSQPINPVKSEFVKTGDTERGKAALLIPSSNDSNFSNGRA
jgi:hypothetical protein